MHFEFGNEDYAWRENDGNSESWVDRTGLKALVWVWNDSQAEVGRWLYAEINPANGLWYEKTRTNVDPPVVQTNENYTIQAEWGRTYFHQWGLNPTGYWAITFEADGYCYVEKASYVAQGVSDVMIYGKGELDGQYSLRNVGKQHGLPIFYTFYNDANGREMIWDVRTGTWALTRPGINTSIGHGPTFCDYASDGEYYLIGGSLLNPGGMNISSNSWTGESWVQGDWMTNGFVEFWRDDDLPNAGQTNPPAWWMNPDNFSNWPALNATVDISQVVAALSNMYTASMQQNVTLEGMSNTLDSINGALSATNDTGETNTLGDVPLVDWYSYSNDTVDYITDFGLITTGLWEWAEGGSGLLYTGLVQWTLPVVTQNYQCTIGPIRWKGGETNWVLDFEPFAENLLYVREVVRWFIYIAGAMYIAHLWVNLVQP